MKGVEAKSWLGALALYLAQGGIYPIGGVLGKLFLVFIYLFGLVNFLRSAVNPFSVRLQFALILCIYFIFISIAIHNNSDEQLRLDFIKKVLFCFSIYFSSEYYFRTNQISKKLLFFYAVIGLCLSISVFLGWEEHETKRLGREIITNNQGYLILSYLPLILLGRSKTGRFILLMLISVFVFLSIKRGAIATLILNLFILLIFEIKSSAISNKIKRKIKGALLVILIFSCLTYLPRVLVGTSLINRLEEGSGARPKNYNALLSHLVDKSSFLDVILGNGAAGSSTLTPENGALAHNDFLEISVDYGLVGMLLYLFWLVSVFLHMRAGATGTHRKLSVIVFFNFIIISTISMWFNNVHTANYFLVICFLINDYRQNVKNSYSSTVN